MVSVKAPVKAAPNSCKIIGAIPPAGGCYQVSAGVQSGFQWGCSSIGGEGTLCGLPDDGVRTCCFVACNAQSRKTPAKFNCIGARKPVSCR